MKSNYHIDSNKLVVCKIKDDTGGVAMGEFVGLKTIEFVLGRW